MPVILGTSESIYGFDPRSLGGCVLWLDGADSNTLFSNADGSGGNSSVGGAVRRWKDKSGLANDFSNRSSNPASYFPTRGSGGGVFIPNAGTPFYNATTYVCIQSVNAFFTFPYYTIYTVVNATAPASYPTLPLLFVSVRRDVERSPNFGMGGSFSVGDPGGAAASSNVRSSMGNNVGASAGEQISNLVTTVAGLISGRLSNTTSIAGTRVSSDGSLFYVPFTTCALGPYQGGWFNTVGGTDQRWFNGTIFETLVFNSELTRGQCEEIEGYLSWKWGRQTALPTTHPFRNIAPLARGFTPIDIPGCVLWLDGADATTTSNINTTWRDKSGNGSNATPTAAVFSMGTINSIPAVRFPAGTNYYTFNTTGTSYLPGISVFFVSSVSAQSSFGGRFLSSSSGNVQIYQATSTGGQATTLPSFLATTGGGALMTSCTLQISANTPFVCSMVLNPSVCTEWKDGTPNAQTAPTAPNSWTSWVLGNFPGLSGYELNGLMGEVLMYNQPLTSVQRQAVEGYLAHKWRLNASLSTSNILRSFPPSSVQQFKPTDINACSLWLDAADLTGPTISTWTDKSGNGSNATANNPITILTNAVNGNSVLSVTTGSVGTERYLNGSIAITGTGLTVISAFKMDSASGGAARIIGLGAPGVNDYNSVLYVGILRQTNNNMGAYRNGTHAAPTLTYGVPAISTTYFDGTTAFSYINGGTASSFASAGNFGITSYSVMANTSNLDNQYFSGYMCEMIVYNSTLTLPQRQQVEGYLSKKWAIALATTHPYYAINPAQMVGGTAIITPSNLPGLIVWNRGDTLAGANGSTVGTWTNSSNASGPTINCTGTQSNAALNGRNVVNFTTAQTWTSSTALTPSSYTFIQVSRQTPSTYGRMFQSSVAGTNHIHGYWNSLKQSWYSEGWLGVGGGGIPSALNEWAIISSTRIQNGAFQNRWNGAVIAAGASSPNVNLSGLAVNTGGQPTERSTCQIAEVILYSNVLTTPQIIGIEEYLRQKWGLGLN